MSLGLLRKTMVRQAMVLGAKVRALLDGRLHAAVEDVREVAMPAMRHRVILNFEAEARGMTADAILNQILAAVPAEAKA